MGDQQDPYHLIKAEIDRELQHVSRLQARLFAGHAEVADALHSTLRDTAEQLQALEAAVRKMVADPSKFNLTSSAAYGRQVEVETLRYTLTDLQETCAQAETSSSSSHHAAASAAAANHAEGVELSNLHAAGADGSSQWHTTANGFTSATTTSSSNSRGRPDPNAPHLPPGPPIKHSKLAHLHQPGGTSSSSNGTAAAAAAKRSPSWPGGGAAAAENADDTRECGDHGISYEEMMQQQMKYQDEALDHISIHVDRIKQAGQAIHEELGEQTGLLTGLQDHVDSTDVRLRGARRKVSDLLRQTRHDSQLRIILVLILVLIVLVVLAIA